MTDKTFDPAKYVEQTAQLIDLPLASEYHPGVVDNFTWIAAIATLVMEFSLPEDIGAAQSLSHEVYQFAILGKNT